MGRRVCSRQNPTASARLGIENKLHWTLDVRFRARTTPVCATANAVQKLNVIRKVAIDLLKAGQDDTAHLREEAPYDDME
ncbi:MAG: hypothetical protein ACI4QT_06060 [Kiritimatiellia bacterium]